MPISLSRVFRNINPPTSSNQYSKHLPMINAITNTLSGYLSAVGQVSKKQYLMRWFKTIPELTGMVNKVAKDVVHKYHFETVNPKESGRNKIMNANRYAATVGLRSVMSSQVVDGLVTGEGYGWLGKIKDETLRSTLKEVFKNYSFLETKDKVQMFESVYKEIKQTDGFSVDRFDEDLLEPRTYRYIASSSMEVIYDNFDILHYIQTVGMNQVEFSTSEIIRIPFAEVDGKVGGFTPVESIVVQLELLRFMWQNMLSVHKNGGSPDKLFVLENTQPNSPGYKRIEEQLKKYKLVENKHGNMLFTGKVTVEDLNALDQMQFKDMGLYITGVIALQWGIPRGSIPYILGGTNTKDDTGGSSEKDYWRTVESIQMRFADIMNSQLWIPYFGVRIVFDNTSVQQDVQLETAKQLKLNNVKFTEDILRSSGKQLKLPAKLRLLSLDEEDLEDFDMENNPMFAMNSTLNTRLSDNEANDSASKKNVRAKKKQEQQNLVDRGSASTTGSVK